MWEKGSLSQEAADKFTAMMHTNISGPAIAIATSGIFKDFKHVMDAGGGSGAFLAALKQSRTNIQLTLLDLPQVCKAAEKIMSQYVDPATVHYAGCNFFADAWPTSADAVYMSNILHDWSFAKGAEILSRARTALTGGGSIFISECLLDENRVAPKHTVIFDMLMYMNHRAQQYTLRELSTALTESGFKNPRPVFKFGYYTVVRADV